MFVIGTAGHIDHGKSALIQALTGIDPDRLKEEKERGMTIDLGFAWLTLPSGREVGIVDVPGHHRFVRNMLAGVGGVSLALFVVAATESWMPQSQEHLDIIDLLGIQRGIVVLTKKDLVDQEWLDMVGEEVRGKLAGTSLAGAEIIPVSALTGEGLPYLVSRIDVMLAQAAPPADTGRPRLWIDRVFTIKGAGPVVTGTLADGAFALEQAAEILPGGAGVRLRGLQTHKRSVEQAEPGTRVAVNVAGIDATELARGDALVGAGQRQATALVHVELRLLPQLDFSLPELCKLQMYVGSAELLAQVRLLDRQELLPGETGLAQFILERPAAIDFRDRYIVRAAERQATIGGGLVLDAQAARARGRDLRLPVSAPGAYKVLSAAAVVVRRLDLADLRARAAAVPEHLIEIILQERGWAAHEELRLAVPLSPAALSTQLQRLAAAGRIIDVPGYAVAAATWQALAAKVQAQVGAFHAAHPLHGGIGRETLRSGMKMEAKLFDAALARLAEEGAIAAQGALLHLPGYEPVFRPEQQEMVERLLALLAAAPFSPPDLEELAAQRYDAEVIGALVEQGRLVKIGKGLVFTAEAVAAVQEKVGATIAAQGEVDVGAMRDMLGTTRKFAVPLLEYMDQIGYTRRIGDKRVLVAPPK